MAHAAVRCHRILLEVALLACSSLDGIAAVTLPLQYELTDSYQGSGFFDKFNFWSDSDPSNGAVHYTGRAEAVALGLVAASDLGAIIRADVRAIPEGAVRSSVRVQSKAVYNGGLFVARVRHAPTGCGLWPAIWLFGEDEEHPWPQWGEYDIVEGVHGVTYASTALHTTSDCRQTDVSAGRDFGGRWYQGLLAGEAATDCYTYAEGQLENQGCQQRGPPGSLGPEFNANGGGTYAAEWDSEAGHMRTWFWPTGTEPADVQQDWYGGPAPDQWGRPFSYFSLDPLACHPSHFKNMRLVINIDLCGDLPESTWEAVCPEEARTASCREYVRANPTAMSEAYWAISGIDIYQKEVLDPGQRSLSLGVGVLIAFCGIAGFALLGFAEMQRQQRVRALAADEHEQEQLRFRQSMLATGFEPEDDPRGTCSMVFGSDSVGIVTLVSRLFGHRQCCEPERGIDVQGQPELGARARVRTDSSVRVLAPPPAPPAPPAPSRHRAGS